MTYNHKKRERMSCIDVGMDIQFVRDVAYGRTLMHKHRKAYVVAVYDTGYVLLAFHQPLCNLHGVKDVDLTQRCHGFKYTKQFTKEFILDHCKRRIV